MGIWKDHHAQLCSSLCQSEGADRATYHCALQSLVVCGKRRSNPGILQSAPSAAKWTQGVLIQNAGHAGRFCRDALGGASASSRMGENPCEATPEAEGHREVE